MLLALAAAGAYLTRHCLAVANTTIQQELGFNNEQFGYLFSAFSIGYLICQIPGGWLGERFGTRTALSLMACIWSALTIVTTTVSNLIAMVVTRALFGMAQAGLVPNQTKIINDWFPVRSRGIASAVVTTAMSIGSVLSFGLTAFLMTDYSWKTVFSWYAGIGFLWAITFFWLFRTFPRDHPWVNAYELMFIENQNRTPQEPQPVILRSNWWNLVSSVSVWGLCFQLLFKAAGYNLFVTFFPAFLELAYDLETSVSGQLATWPLLGVVIGTLGSGFLIDAIYRCTQNKWYSRCVLSAVSLFFTAILMVVSTWMRTVEQMTTLVTLAALFSGAAIPATWAAVIDVGGRRSAVVMGTVNSVGNLAGVIIAPLVGRLMDRIVANNGEWNLILYVHAVFYLIAAASWLIVNPESKIQSHNPLRV